MKQIHPWLRNLFYMGGLLSLMAGMQLFILSEQTETYFAWTIQSPLTAATFGAFYFGTMVFGFLSGREINWAHVRGPALGLLVFISVTLAATLLHLDKFHLTSQNGLTLMLTWVWMLIYVLMPPMLIFMLIRQVRAEGNDPEPTLKISAWVRTLLLARGMAGSISALLLFFTPQLIMPIWPWALTPLTSRVLSAWLISFSVVDLQAAWENDWQHAKIMTIGYIIFGLLALIAMARYAGEVNWPSVGNIVYMIYLLSMALVGIIGQMQTRRAQKG